jgi:diguanylate cyclase (GGDEF)-like protein/PAS domain S-box-containing protein
MQSSESLDKELQKDNFSISNREAVIQMQATENKIRFEFLDEIGLVIIGAGASALYYICEKIIDTSQDLVIAITVSVILLISVFTQLLLNHIKKSKEALRIAVEALETNVQERTARLRESENKYRTIFENTGTATIIIEENMTISLANSEFVNIAGFSKEEIENRKSWVEFIDNESHKKLLAKNPFAVSGKQPSPLVKNFECQFIDKTSNQKNILFSFAPIPGTNKSVASIVDISELKEAEKQIYHQAFHDTLTNLPNRALFMEHLSMAMKRAKRRDDYNFAVLSMDIDRFKLINDSLGHNLGDKLLVAFANKLKKSMRNVDTLARFGGDEFAVLIEDIENKNFVITVAERILQTLREPFILDGNEIFTSASCGLVLNTGEYKRPEYIIRDADTAMYHAKEKGRAQFQIFDSRLHEKATHLLQIETDLRKAIDNNEFELHYQPIISLDNLSIIGFEALIRWHHPDNGLTLPEHFIPVAEETGLIVPVGKWVLNQACNDMVKWQKKIVDHTLLFMSVNISGKQFLRPNVITEIQEILQDSGLPPNQLKLEITETALMEDRDEAVRVIKRLKESGIQIVIDDFGTGYSSMSYLQQLPIDTLKIDRSFVSKINEVPDENKNIVETIINLAHQLNMNVVAEGVETAAQHSALSDMKCQLAQGFLFSKPLKKKKMEALIRKMERFARTNPGMRYSLKELMVN